MELHTIYKADEYLKNVNGSVFSHSFFNQFFARPEFRSTLNIKESQLTSGYGASHESLKGASPFSILICSSPYISLTTI